MSEALFLGLDIGGGGARALLLDPTSGANWCAERAWQSCPAAGTGGIGYDIDLDALWEALCAATADVLAQAGVDAGRVGGIAATAMRFSMVVIDADGNALLAVPNRDARAAGEAFGLGLENAEGLAASSGVWPTPVSWAPRLLWLREKRSEAFERASTVFSLSDWLAWRLSGVRASEPTQAGGSLLLDLETRRWSETWIDRLELPRALFPEIHEPGSVLGELQAEAAAAFGLRAGVPIAAGLGDSQAALLGAGVLAPGQAAVVGGTTVPVMQVLEAPRVQPEGRLWVAPHCTRTAWVVESNAGPVGDSLAWNAGLFFGDAPDPLARLFGEAQRAEPGASGAMSTLGGQIMNARELGLPVGFLCLSHFARPADPRREDLARSLAEGAAFSIRANLEQASAHAGHAPKALRLCAGLSRSSFFGALLADVTGLPVEATASSHSSAIGAALCAAVGAGFHADLEEAAKNAAPVGTVHTPGEASGEIYPALYEAWCRAYEAEGEARRVAGGSILPWALRAAEATAAAAGGERPQPRILCCADLDEAARVRLSGLGEFEYASFREKHRLLTGASLVEALEGVEVLLTEIDLVDAASLAKCPELRVVAACRGDAVNVDVEACTAHGIPVLYAPGRNADAVADLTLSFLLMLARKLPAANAFLRQPEMQAGDMGKMGQAFSTFRGNELGGRCVGLVGLGAVGRAVAKRLAGFGARVLAADPFAHAEQAACAGVELVTLDELLAESDFVSLHAAVTAETRGMLGAAEFERMKEGACLINTARAALVDEDALCDALTRGHLGGAALDTFAVEPPGSDHPLLQLDHVIATPHLGGNTVEVGGHQGRIVAEALEALLAGKRPRAILNPQVLESFDWSAGRPVLDSATLAELALRPPPAVSDLQRDSRKKSQTHSQPAAAFAEPTAAELSGAGGIAQATRDALAAIIDAFLSAMCRDEEVERFAADQDLAMHFNLHDTDLEFWFALRTGEVTGARGAPTEQAEVNLSLSADTLDGMLTGRLNAMESAMQGDISFTGDAGKAMTLQQLQPHLRRLYSATREELGAPGDLIA